jgi:hypothetical protein
MSTTTTQRDAALLIANERRLRMANVIVSIAACDRAEARVRLRALLRDPSPEVETIRVRRLLCAAPGIGDEWVRRAFLHLGLTDQLVRNLSPRQRAELARVVMLPLADIPGPAAGRTLVVPSLAVNSRRLAAVRAALRPYVPAEQCSLAAHAALMAAAS